MANSHSIDAGGRGSVGDSGAQRRTVRLVTRRLPRREATAIPPQVGDVGLWGHRSEEHTSELQSLMRISYAGFSLKKKKSHQSSRKEYNNHENQTPTRATT